MSCGRIIEGSAFAIRSHGVKRGSTGQTIDSRFMKSYRKAKIASIAPKEQRCCIRGSINLTFRNRQRLSVETATGEQRTSYGCSYQLLTCPNRPQQETDSNQRTVMTIEMIRIRMIQETKKRPRKPTRLSGRPAPAPALGKIGRLERPPGLGETPVRGNVGPRSLPFPRSLRDHSLGLTNEELVAVDLSLGLTNEEFVVVDFGLGLAAHRSECSRHWLSQFWCSRCIQSWPFHIQ